MISAKLGHFLDRPLSSLAKTININPNLITIAGFVITTAAAITLPQNLALGGALILFGGLFDIFDGIIARVNNRSTNFGAFLDSVLDRYSDAFLFLGFSWYFYRNNSVTGVYLSLGTMIGALIISYARARAEGLGKNCHTGIMERPERVVLMAFGALTGWVMPVMWIMIVLTHVTALQRIYHVWKVMRKP
ncbi:MAG TPA: CDP-alcohol phosphatidyltransferase family protein [Nitrospirae bacterium]|nr:CDP-alcohol phosphatidyltransferase family protein [Nitrospirota bacterium]HDK16786.1 CDP-alcohol phosphatidyltransferase family protein [Nitrospirota bacterium]